MFTRTKTEPVPEVGAEAPEFNLPSAQGGQLKLSMRTVMGPVVVAFYRPGDEEDVEYFKALAAKEEEINLAAGSVVAIGIAEPNQALNFARASGLKSYVLYDYAKVTSRQWGLWERDRRQGDYARRAVFVVGPDHKVAYAWVGERPEPEEILAKVSEISGLPKTPEEPKEDGKDTESKEGDGKPKKMSAEEREKIKTERRAAREAGKSVKTSTSGPTAPTEDGGDKPKKMSAEERQRIKAERRAAREAGKSLKKPASAESKEPPETGSEGSEEEAKKEG
jgi:peroxiredoxin